MAKSEFAQAVDEIQRGLRPYLKECGYRSRGRTFNRLTEDGLTQVVKIRMGPFDPPAWTEVPGLRRSYYGLFTVDLGVYVPEVARFHIRTEAKSWVQETLCCVRTGLSDKCGEKAGLWWHANACEKILDDVLLCLKRSGVPFLDRFSTRDKILSEWENTTENSWAGDVPRLITAIIYVVRGQMETARKLLMQQYQDARERHPPHAQYVRELAVRLGCGPLARGMN